ncbi:hypothetical protein HY605_01585 [Candidatus Peregrinibacteria bacterium]|nr:hypothetical protein [Candidatus Peregrinibacteria bacterium]
MVKSICFGSKELTQSKNNANKQDVIVAGSSASMISKPKDVQEPVVIVQPKTIMPKTTIAIQPKPITKKPVAQIPSQPAAKLKIMTENCGEVEVFTEDVIRIWGYEGIEEFSLDVKDRTGKYEHHVYSIDTATAKRLSELSNIPITIGKQPEENATKQTPSATTQVAKPKPKMVSQASVKSSIATPSKPSAVVQKVVKQEEAPDKKVSFAVNSEIFREASLLLSKIVQARSYLTTLRGVKLETLDSRLRLSGTDMERFLIADIPVINGDGGSIDKPAILSLDDLKRIGKTSTGELRLDITKERVLASYNSDYGIVRNETLQRMDDADFPDVPSPKGEFTAVEGLGLALSEVGGFCSDDGYSNFRGILLSKGEVVSCDQKRLYRRFVTALNQEPDVLIPNCKLFGLKRYLMREEIGIFSDKEMVWLSFGNIFWGGKVIEAQFPNYKTIVPESCENVLTLSKEVMDAITHILKSLPYEDNHAVRIEFKNDNGWEMVLTSLGKNSGSAELKEVNYDGNEASFCINPDYFIDALGVDGMQYFGFNQPKQPTIAWGDEVQIVTMPLSDRNKEEQNPEEATEEEASGKEGNEGEENNDEPTDESEQTQDDAADEGE